MSDSLNRYLDTVPPIYKPATNRVIAALLVALAAADDDLAQQVENGKDQNFVLTAAGTYLDQLANSLGVSRPTGLGMSDQDFQQLIPNLSLKPKQIKKAFYDTADVFWGPLFSRANITTSNFAPFNVSPGDEIDVSIDAGAEQSIVALTGDIAVPGAATAQEIVNILNKIDGVTATILTDIVTGNESVNLRTNTPGSVGSVNILSSSTMATPSKLAFPLGEYDILNLAQRVCVYNVTPNTLIIDIPAVLPIVRRTLLGSHHFHTDGTLSPAVPPADGIWAGSFFFNPDGSEGQYTVTSQIATLNQTISKGSVLTSLTVDTTSLIQGSSGNLMLNFGQNTQEVPVKYRGIPNSNTILIDPSYVWLSDHSPGEKINIILNNDSYTPRSNGQDLAIYLTSPSGARSIVQSILSTLAAAGIVIDFNILAPTYDYLIDNPFTDPDDT